MDNTGIIFIKNAVSTPWYFFSCFINLKIAAWRQHPSQSCSVKDTRVILLLLKVHAIQRCLICLATALYPVYRQLLLIQVSPPHQPTMMWSYSASSNLSSIVLSSLATVVMTCSSFTILVATNIPGRCTRRCGALLHLLRFPFEIFSTQFWILYATQA